MHIAYYTVCLQDCSSEIKTEFDFQRSEKGENSMADLVLNIWSFKASNKMKMNISKNLLSASVMIGNSLHAG